jgi:N-alpha-acetyltransferase 15/16, NatA auxiliary subunit
MDGFRRGVPSLFVDLKPLFQDNEKHGVLQDIVESVHQMLCSDHHSDPTLLVWCMYFLTQHASLVGDQLLALSRLHWLEEHTPTLPELYTLKAKALKRGGDLLGASQAMEEARCLDLQDRFLNWKAAKYMLRAGKIEPAISILGLFTKVYGFFAGLFVLKVQTFNTIEGCSISEL